MQAKLTEQQTRTKEAEETIELLKKENGVMKGHGVKLKNAQKEIERLREAWTDKDVKLAEANSSASQQRHVGLTIPLSPPSPPTPWPATGKLLITVKTSAMAPNGTPAASLQSMAITYTIPLKTMSDCTVMMLITIIVARRCFTILQVWTGFCFRIIADH